MAIKIKEGTFGWTVYSLQIAVKLAELGHEVITNKPNFEDLTKKVFIFKVDDTFEEDLNTCITKSRESKKN